MRKFRNDLVKPELLVEGEDGKQEFVTLFKFMRRGQHRAPWATTVKLLPDSSRQTGLFLAVLRTERFAERELLLEAAVKPAVVGNLYSLVVSVDSDCNIDFKLQCHNGGQDADVVQALGSLTFEVGASRHPRRREKGNGF